MVKKGKYIVFNAFLVKDEFRNIDFAEYIKSGNQIKSYDIAPGHGQEGRLFVKRSKPKRPGWGEFLDLVAGNSIEELINSSSSAILVIKSKDSTIAYSFGYGRFMVETKFFVQDFGIKTALNTLDHGSLRGVDLVTLGDQALQKKAQASRVSGISVFGIDISQDVLRAVTGSPKPGVTYRAISGGDMVYSFGARIDIQDLDSLTSELFNHYNNDSYKSDFAWVDNIRKVKEKSLLDALDEELVKDIKKNKPKFIITIPEIMKWDEVHGFSFTRTKSEISAIIDRDIYHNNLDRPALTVDSLKRDRLFVYDIHENEFDYSIYKSIYFEYKEKMKTYILFSGLWFEIDNDFMKRIDQTLDLIEVSKLKFPTVLTSTVIKDGKQKEKIETEGDYNARTAKKHRYYLLDKKLIKSKRNTSAIELCDLLTSKKQFVHVKHRKGGSAGLSHLFAQGSVAAQIMLGDKEFRKAARTVLRRINTKAQNIVPLDKFVSDGVEIVYLILGEEASKVKKTLPFFSKVNLTKAYEDLSQRGFSVTVSGVGKEAAK